MKARFNENEELILNRRRYNDFYSKKNTISRAQAMDGALIQAHPNVAYYEPEYRDYIDDYEHSKPNHPNQYYRQQVFWDHVIVTKNGNVVIFESDDPSHRDFSYCVDSGYLSEYSDFLDIKVRDKIKDTWAIHNGVKLVRIPSYLTFQQKFELIDNSIKDY